MPGNNWHGQFDAKTVVEDPAVTKYIDNLNSSHNRFNRDIMEQVNWALSQNISSRPHLTSGNYSLYKMELNDATFSHLLILLTENENEITLLNIEAIPLQD